MTVRTLVGAVALTLAFALPGVAAAQTSLTLGSAKRAPDVGATFDQEFADAVSGTTGAKVDIQYVGNEQEMVQQVIRGRLDLGVTSPLGLSAAIPEIAILNVPYLWISQAERDYVYAHDLKEPLAKLFADHGLVLLSVQDAGYNGVYCKFDCVDPSSLKGQKIRVSPSASSKLFWDSVGAIPIQLPLSDAWPALEQNLVVGGDQPMGFFSTTPGAESAKFFVFTNHTHSPWLYFAGQQAWNGLSAEQQQAVVAAMPAEFSTTARLLEAQDVRAEAYRKTGGQTFALDEAGVMAWASLVVPNIDGFIAGMSPVAQDIYAAVKTGKADFAASAK